jgi:cytochrome c oxidase assembly protein subunit 15
MVMSGLVDVPAVSHFRLAAHLVLALVVSQWILWLILNISAPWKNAKPLPGGLLLPTALLSLLYLQIIFGAFVAGKRAGLMSSTFPDMNGHYLPGPFFGYRNVFYEMANNPLAIHYTHRLLGTIVVLAFLGAGVYLYRRSTTSMDRRLSTSLIGLVLAQFSLGVLTVVHLVPLEIAVAHQGGAVLLLGLLTALLHRQQGQAAHSA